MPKHILKQIDITTLLVAMDHVQEFGPAEVMPDPVNQRAECAYLTYIGEEQLAIFVARLPHITVMFKTPGKKGRNKIPRKVFHLPALIHVMKFVFGDVPDFLPFLQNLSRIDEKYWRIMVSDEDPFQRKSKKKPG